MSWRGHMFGVAVQSACELVGCEPGETAPELPRLTLRPASLDALPAPGRPLTWWAGDPDLRHDAATGYRIDAPGLARFHVSPEGATVSYAAGDGPAWRWQRYLIGRVLPLAVTLLGREPLHASAVACGDGAVLLAGESGSGKTMLAAELTLAGLSFMSDDVVALSLQDRELLAHPGPGLMSLRRPYALGETVGADQRARWVAVEREPGALPVSALYLLDHEDPPGVAPLSRSEPAALLAASFNLVLRDPARLTRQLDVFAALAGVRVVRVGVPAEPDFGALAAELLADLRCRVPA